MVMINKKCYFSVLCIGAEIHDLYEEYLGKLNLLFAIYQHTHSIYIYVCVYPSHPLCHDDNNVIKK